MNLMSLLGSGMAKTAAKRLANRQQQINAAVNAASAGKPYPASAGKPYPKKKKQPKPAPTN